MSDAHLVGVERRMHEVVLRKGDWTPDPSDLEDFSAEYDRRGAEIARLRTAATSLLQALEENLDLSEDFNPPTAEELGYRMDTLSRVLTELDDNDDVR